MDGIDPYAYMNQVAAKLDSLTRRDQVEKALDDVEYLFEVIPPEMQDQAEALIDALRKRLSEFE
jgi:hypothetical protein